MSHQGLQESPRVERARNLGSIESRIIAVIPQTVLLVDPVVRPVQKVVGPVVVQTQIPQFPPKAVPAPAPAPVPVVAPVDLAKGCIRQATVDTEPSTVVRSPRNRSPSLRRPRPVTETHSLVETPLQMIPRRFLV